jgi:hypothetical protein
MNLDSSLIEPMIFELIGTWLVVGFFSAVGWNVADETVNKPYLDPWLEKKMGTKAEQPTNPIPPAESANK